MELPALQPHPHRPVHRPSLRPTLQNIPQPLKSAKDPFQLQITLIHTNRQHRIADLLEWRHTELFVQYGQTDACVDYNHVNNLFTGRVFRQDDRYIDHHDAAVHVLPPGWHPGQQG